MMMLYQCKVCLVMIMQFIMTERLTTKMQARNTNVATIIGVQFYSLNYGNKIPAQIYDTKIAPVFCVIGGVNE